MKKLTKSQMFAQIKSHLTDADEIAFIEHEIELVDKKNANKASKPTKKQVENADLRAVILDSMEDGKQYTITDLIKSVPELADESNQRVSALVRQLKEAHLVNREEIKRVAYFSKASVEEG